MEYPRLHDASRTTESAGSFPPPVEPAAAWPGLTAQRSDRRFSISGFTPSILRLTLKQCWRSEPALRKAAALRDRGEIEILTNGAIARRLASARQSN